MRPLWTGHSDVPYRLSLWKNLHLLRGSMPYLSRYRRDVFRGWGELHQFFAAHMRRLHWWRVVCLRYRPTGVCRGRQRGDLLLVGVRHHRARGLVHRQQRGDIRGGGALLPAEHHGDGAGRVRAAGGLALRGELANTQGRGRCWA